MIFNWQISQCHIQLGLFSLVANQTLTLIWNTSDSCGFVGVGRSLWRENGSAVYNCCWASPAQSFLGPSPAGLVAIFYCLRFETPPTWRAGPCIYIPQKQGGTLHPQAQGSLFVASDDSQGYVGGIRTRLHAGLSNVMSKTHPQFLFFITTLRGPNRKRRFEQQLLL
jgi:hypothetical protein